METVVKLSCVALDMKDQEFPITHAQAVLDKEREMGVSNWKLTDDKFTLDNGTIQRKNTGADKGAGKQKPTVEGS
jgi:hypothetical protein